MGGGQPPYGDGVVVLRDWRADDVDQLGGWLQPGHRWQRLDAPYLPRPDAAGRRAVVEQLHDRVRGADLPTPRQGLVVASADDQRFLGEVGWYWESEATDWRRMGLALYDPALWDRGFGSRALRLWTTYLFASTAVRRLDFATWSGNAGMLGIGRRLGFREEARFRQARVVDGQPYDSVVMGMLRGEWRPADS